MSDKIIVKHCSPTLAGIKTGNLFTYRFKDIKELKSALRRLNQILVKKGVRILPLCYKNNSALIYLYRPAQLLSDLKQELACEILKQYGYDLKAPQRIVINLIKRLNESENFPHEIGLFLGYPPEDVSGFINNKASGYKCCGCWKVYGDEKKAQATFVRYKKCSNVYYRCYIKGKSIERLTVAV